MHLTEKESSISVAVRVRPLTQEERQYLIEDDETFKDFNDHNLDDISFEESCDKSEDINNKENILTCPKKHKNILIRNPFSIKKIVDIVDDRMLIFDPKPNNHVDSISASLKDYDRRKKYNDIGIGTHNKRKKEHKFIFDRLFDEDATQNEIYESTTKPSIDAVLNGYNSTIFAYGATGCGKTYTISGTPENPGVIFLAVKELFNRIQNQEDKHITVQVSYLEIYNEMIKDLLNIETNPKRLTLLENQNKEITVSNLTLVDAGNVEEVMDVIIKGNYNRTVSPTAANATSSRSHAVLQVYVNLSPYVSDIYENTSRSVLSIIDLAGSERASATKNKGMRLYEGANINKSLLALGNCINALCDPRKALHVPYRDSKLTRLLKFSLGGNCKTVMIVCISPSSRHYDETLNALKFANRAKEIKTKLVKNRTTVMKHVGSYMKIISDQKRRIYELETLMDSTVKREINRYIESRNNIKLQIHNMVQRLQNNIQKCDNLKMEKVVIVAKRKLFMIYNKQLTDFYTSLEKFELDKHLDPLKTNLLTVMEEIKLQIISLEEEYNCRTDLDTILLETSDSFLRKLEELDGWTDNDKDAYLKEIKFLKAETEKQIFYESSVLFDSWIANAETIGNIDSIPSILAQYLYMIENVAGGLKTVEEARMKCYELSDNLIQSCMQRLNSNIENISSNFVDINKKRKRKKSNESIGVGINEETTEASFLRGNNRINSVNNKLMRINLDREEGGFMDSFSEVESSLILDNNLQSGIQNNKRVNSVTQNDVTPQINRFFDVEKVSPDIIRRFTPVKESIDESDSSVVIRKPRDSSFVSPYKVSATESPIRKLRVKSKNAGNGLTSRKLVASPKITSPSRLVGLASNNNVFHMKVRESMGGLDFLNQEKELSDIKKDTNVDTSMEIEL